ncbi:hypothetical protein ABBQ38_001199 [Trebouxia sp. C0009 RCD-2024]
MILTINTRSGRALVSGGVDVADQASVEDLKAAISKANPKYYPSRQRLTLPPEPGQRSGNPLLDGKTLTEYNLTNGSTVVFKDLGTQVGWTTVFFWEYFGPLAVYPLFYFLPQLLYPGTKPAASKHHVQTWALLYWEFHYAKRILETFFVHRYSKGSMPIANLYRNCSYYWIFAAFVSYFINHPLYTPPPVQQSAVALTLAMVCQLCNLRSHLILRNLRPLGSKEYVIPKGFAFNYITCANYTFEIYGWILFGIATQTVAAFMFVAAGSFPMSQWAIGKHKRLRKMFDGTGGKPKYPKRWVVFPPFL